MFTKEEIALAKPCYEAIKKISKGKWEWKPEVGEFYYHNYGNRRILLVDDEDKAEDIVERNLVERLRIIPLLHWEKLEEILEGMGYRLEIKDDLCDDLIKINKRERYLTWHFASIHGVKVKVKELMRYTKKVSHISTVPIVQGLSTKTRQEAVMRAVIELGKEE